MSWLRELVDVPVAPEAARPDLHMAGFEVASVEGDDPVIDFEITANRPDCLSMIGLAREVATRYGTSLREPQGADARPVSMPASWRPLTVADREPDRVPSLLRGHRRCALSAPRPPGCPQRLTAAGIRSISNIVDVTNYVLLELGHPLHAFDLDTLAGQALRIRSARAGETLDDA